MATKLGYDPDQVPPAEQAVELPLVAERGDAQGAGAPQVMEPLLDEQTPEPPMSNPYPGFVRVGIFVGGAILCWAAIAGVLALVL